MNLDRLVRRASEQLAAQPSRRGFVATLAVGVSAVLAGLRSPGEAAAQTSGACCTGTTCRQKQCPKKTKRVWSWFCTNDDGVRYLCKDCSNASGEFVCNFWKKQ